MISAIVHTFNEEKNIERCLSSLSWVDEIVIIDMGSTDKTLEIAGSYKTKVFNHPFTGFVEPARNFGIDKAKGDWIMIVDADEEISKSLNLYLSVEAKSPKFDFYRIARKNIIFGRWIKRSGWWPDYQIRFFKKGSVKWTEKIHGVPITAGSGTDIEAVENLCITHYNYQNLEQYVERLNRYTSITAKELYLANEKFLVRNLIESPAKEFINRFFVWEGYKDGMHGLGLSLLQSFSELVVYLKLWELEKYKETHLDLSKVGQLMNNEFKQKNFWLTETLLKEQTGIFEKLLLKIKRKIIQYV